ncbi:unnamed protein product [Blepharisma stoltei]|uniref:ATP synthase F0 subunit 8 n=1 Tax=Blepharisma stoltei TaxID=1481888 RepID=A0AAU9KK43_9CILI|nr:unnamed protein product [Blepharisma stoltei]
MDVLWRELARWNEKIKAMKKKKMLKMKMKIMKLKTQNLLIPFLPQHKTYVTQMRTLDVKTVWNETMEIKDMKMKRIKIKIKRK